MVSAMIFGKLVVLFMRPSQGTNINYKLYSFIAFRIVGKFWNIIFKVLEDNVKFSMSLRQLASLLVSSVQHHIKKITSPFPSSFPHTHISHPYLCSYQCIEDIRLCNKLLSPAKSLFLNQHPREKVKESSSQKVNSQLPGDLNFPEVL